MFLFLFIIFFFFFFFTWIKKVFFEIEIEKNSFISNSTLMCFTLDQSSQMKSLAPFVTIFNPFSSSYSLQYIPDNSFLFSLEKMREKEKTQCECHFIFIQEEEKEDDEWRWIKYFCIVLWWVYCSEYVADLQLHSWSFHFQQQNIR